MALGDAILARIASVALCIFKFGAGTFTSLYLDSLTPTQTVIINISHTNSVLPVDILPNVTASWERIDPLISIWISMGFDTLLLGTVVVCLMLCFPGKITEQERGYPKSQLLFAGSFQAISAIMFQFSMSGSRTAPYLQGALGYFYIPIAFTLRFLILRKRPTRLKLLCAFVIVLASFISLIPTIFPQLESQEAKQHNGGASGVAGVLWPLCLVLSGAPHAVWNVLLERSVKDRALDARRLNMAYVMFWNFLGTFLTALLLFWVDVIPGFGLVPDMQELSRQLLFNLRCIFGIADQCGFHQIFTGWARMVCKTSAFVTSGFLVRYGEGANFYAILLALNQPLRFLFYSLFDEQPFRWSPHTSLSTWLCIGGLFVMFPSVIVYNMSPSNEVVQVEIDDNKADDASDNETSDLLGDARGFHDNSYHTDDRQPTNIQYSGGGSDQEQSSLIGRHQSTPSYGSVTS